MDNKERSTGVISPKVEYFGVVIGGLLNFRKRPNFDSDVIKILDEGTKVKIISDKNTNFYKVLVGEVEGYCMKKFIKKEQ